VYQELKDYDKAEEILTEAYKLDRNNLGVISSLGDILFILGKFESAVLKYEKANKLGEIPEVHLHLGHCYYILEQFEYAVSNYISALKLVKNTRHDYYYYCANALVAATRIKDGVKCYKAAIKIKKTKGLYYYNLAIAYFLLKKYPKTLKNLEKLKRIIEKYPGENDDLKITKNDIEFLKFKSYFLMPSIDYDKCEHIIKNLISNNPDNIEYYDSLASLQEKTNKPNLAIETYKDILKIDKENITAKNALRRLDPNSLKDENLKEEAKNSSAKSKISNKESSDKIKGEIILINEKSDSKKSESNKASSILKKTLSIKDKISSENEKLISEHSEKELNQNNKQSNKILISNNKHSSGNLINNNIENKKEEVLKSGLHLIDIDDNESDSDTIKNEDEEDL
jgi:tetratricopeptide (TPR) repeat protein